MKKTILIVNGVMNRGGAEAMIMDLVRKMKDDFHFAFLITRKKGDDAPGDYDDELNQMGISLLSIGALWEIGPFAYRKQFRAAVKRIGSVDIVHSHMNSKGGFISKCAAECGIVGRIVHCHAKLIFDGSPLSRLADESERKLQWRWINRYATDYWACSREAMQSLFTPEHIAGKHAQVVHNAIDIGKFTGYHGQSLREELHLPTDAIVIGSIGRIADVKNYVLAANVIRQLWQKGIDVHYIVAGRKQDNASVDALFSQLGGDRRFHYLGIREDIEKLYHGLDLYLGTSKREGLGLSAVEAQACGISCVLSAGFPSLCDMGLSLVSVCMSENASVWADTIETALHRKVCLTNTMIEEAITGAGFDIEMEAERVKNLYDEIGNGR